MKSLDELELLGIQPLFCFDCKTNTMLYEFSFRSLYDLYLCRNCNSAHLLDLTVAFAWESFTSQNITFTKEGLHDLKLAYEHPLFAIYKTDKKHLLLQPGQKDFILKGEYELKNKK